jgi:RHS repeat-associated protein
MEYFLADSLGSVRQFVENNGEVALIKAYQPYGEVMDSAGSSVTSYGFTGEWLDETGLVYLRARYYAPGQGRFLTMDPWRGDLNRPNTLNPYLYASGNPLVFSDPSGKCPQPPSGSGNVICVDLFIQTETILYFGFGDNREFDTNSAPEASRAFMYIHLDEMGRILKTPTTINPSCTTTFGCFGLHDEYNTFTAEQDSGDLYVMWKLLNGFNAMLFMHAEEAYREEACIGLMPHYSNFVLLMGLTVDYIDGEMKLSKMANEKYEITYMRRDHYPSLEIYFYEDGLYQYTVGTFPEKFGPVFGLLLGLRGFWKEKIGSP